jgi:hypothetical protein
MTTNQQQLDRPESGALFFVAVGCFVALCAAAHFAAGALAAGLPLPGLPMPGL